ncbi:Sec-independent protein translocase protein TatB [Aliihoeflea sp. 40Bstr573]|uniref:Sec-independent protein translocase protein TatB n=1 Tax=Aliihoeflea sp. 40Bstr573 TaxID=2696467 RepID=UPI00273A5BF2|nr:Sec-independent protein translocase protein TatB [Aliihoeflea sp. 40Bstr573]MCO6385680.1 twin-arginine translocase subunit TatB [Aliihoeflea sp. 40Bstr573]
MIDLSWSEILVVAIVLIVVVGPKDLPRLLRSFGKTMSTVRSMAGDFRKQFDEAIKEADLKDLKSLADDARKLNPASEIRKALNPMEQAAKDVRSGLDKAMTPATPISAEKPSSTPQPAAPQKAGATAMPEAMTKAPSVATPAPAEAPVKAARPAKASAAKAAAKGNGTAAPTKAATAKPVAKTKPATKAAKTSTAKAKADK